MVEASKFSVRSRIEIDVLDMTGRRRDSRERERAKRAGGAGKTKNKLDPTPQSKSSESGYII